MKFGFNMLLWTTHVTDDHAPHFARLKTAGYDGVEIPLFEGEVAHYAALGRRLADEGLTATAVTVMPAGRSAVSDDPAMRTAALDHLQWAIDCSNALGADVLCGPFHQPLGEFTGRGPTEREVMHCAEVHKTAARIAAYADLTLAVEPLNRFECYFLNTAAQSADLVARVGEPNYGYLYDTFHFHIEENDQPAAIAATIGAIAHVHISENTRGVPGAGQVDFAAVYLALRSAGYQGWTTVEAFGSALPDLAAATKIWRPLFSSPEEVYLGAIAVMKRHAP